MKHLVYLTTIVTTAIVSIAPMSVKAQSVIDRGLPPGYAATTIYVPATETTTTTTTTIGPSSYPGANSFPNSNNTYYGGDSSTMITPTIPNLYPGTNSFPNSNNTYSGGGSYLRDNGRSKIVIQQDRNYPRAVESRCSTTIVGSPIPSPVAVDRSSGQPCR